MSLKFVCQPSLRLKSGIQLQEGPLNSTGLLAVANEVIKPHDISMPPAMASRISLFVRRSPCHWLLPAVCGGVCCPASSIVPICKCPFARRHPQTALKAERGKQESELHMTICSYRARNLSLSIAFHPKHFSPT